MSPAEYAQRWNQIKATKPEIEQYFMVLETAPPKALEGLGIPDAAKQFLVQAGLPKNAAPGFRFHDLSRGLEALSEAYGLDFWNADEEKIVASFCVIGTDVNADPVCVDRGGLIHIIEIDDERFLSQFDDVKPDCIRLITHRGVKFVNSSLLQLAEFLLIVNASTHPKEAQCLFASIDAPAIEENTFWHKALRDAVSNFQDDTVGSGIDDADAL